MIAMILISLLPTTNNIPNDYQGKRTATLAVPKGKDFIFQVLQVYELKKKLLIPLNFLLPLMMMLMVLFMTQSWSRCWWWCPTAPGDCTREQGRWHRWDVSHFSCRNCNSSRQTIWHTILQGYFNDFKSFLDCFDENSELDNLLDFLCFNYDLGIEYAYSRPATSLANPSREQVNMDEFYKSNQIWNAWALPIGQPNLFFLKVDTLRQSIWLAGDTGTGCWSFQGVIFWSVGE